MLSRLIMTVCAVASLLSTAIANAAVPGLINLQGRLTDAASNPLPDASYSVTFRIYDNAGPGGTILWSEATSVSTSSGLFTTNLGSVTSIPSALFDNPDRWLGIQVQGFAEMFPRTRLTSVAYANNAAQWTSAGQDLFRLNGNVGLGTTSPAAKLHLGGVLEGIRLQGPTTGAANYTFLSFYDGAGTRVGYIGDGSSEDSDVFLTANVGNVVLYTSAGAVLTASPLGEVAIGTAPNGDTQLRVQSGGFPNAVVGVSTYLGGNGVVGGAHNGQAAYGVWGSSSSGEAGHFNGTVNVAGNLVKSAGSFKIDHPLDPANKYLSHSFVESPDMMNIYNGIVVTDAKGDATVSMPEWFDALNKGFRYQLTVIGEFAQAIISNEIEGNQFSIKTDKPKVKVSWQVTGVRQDAYANAHRIQVEKVKPTEERGFYIHPEVFSQPEEKGIEWARRPEMMKQMKEVREKAQAKANKQ